MARPAETYRAHRRNAFFGRIDAQPKSTIWFECLLDGSSWERPFDPTVIKKRIYMTRGWDYSKGDREKFDAVAGDWKWAKKKWRAFLRTGEI